MNVSVEYIEEILNYISHVNHFPFNEIMWVKDGVELEISDEIREEFKFTGLSNCSFVEMEFWNGSGEME